MNKRKLRAQREAQLSTWPVSELEKYLKYMVRAELTCGAAPSCRCPQVLETQQLGRVGEVGPGTAYPLLSLREGTTSFRSVSLSWRTTSSYKDMEKDFCALKDERAATSLRQELEDCEQYWRDLAERQTAKINQIKEIAAAKAAPKEVPPSMEKITITGFKGSAQKLGAPTNPPVPHSSLRELVEAC